MEELTHDSLKKVAHMAEEMQDKMGIWEIQRDDLLGMYELKEDENTRLKNEIEILEACVDCLRDELGELDQDNDDLRMEAQKSRVSFTKLQVAVSVIIFAYGWLYGTFFCPA